MKFIVNFSLDVNVKRRGRFANHKSVRGAELYSTKARKSIPSSRWFQELSSNSIVVMAKSFDFHIQ
jgi:hypothetical protein